MARFREEWYATRRYKALARREEGQKSDPEPDPWQSRLEYLHKPLQVRKAIKKNQATERMNGF